MKPDRCGLLALRLHEGDWFRALPLRYWKTRLSTDHTRILKARYHRGSPSEPTNRTLYLGGDHQAALYEVGALLGSPTDPVAQPRGSWVIMSIHVRLERIADLCDPAQQKLIGTNSQELTGNWADLAAEAPTQRLGLALFDLPELEGFLHPSAKTGRRNLVVFPEKLGPRSSLGFVNELKRDKVEYIH